MIHTHSDYFNLNLTSEDSVRSTSCTLAITVGHSLLTKGHGISAMHTAMGSLVLDSTSLLLHGRQAELAKLWNAASGRGSMDLRLGGDVCEGVESGLVS